MQLSAQLVKNRTIQDGTARRDTADPKSMGIAVYLIAGDMIGSIGCANILMVRCWLDGAC